MHMVICMDAREKEINDTNQNETRDLVQRGTSLVTKAAAKGDG